MTPDDFIRAITPFNPAVDSEKIVGTSNPKYAFNARRRSKAQEATAAAFRADVAAASKGDAAAAARCLATHDSSSPSFLDAAARVDALRASLLTVEDYNRMMSLHGMHVSEGSFLALVDQDGDGLLSFGEYMFFLTLLAVSSDQFEVAFKAMDRDGDGAVDQREFEQILSEFRDQYPQGRRLRDKDILGRDLGRAKPGGMLKMFFGVEGKNTLSLDTFLNYVKSVRRAVLELEYKHANASGSGVLTAEEWGMYLVAFAPEPLHSDLVKRANVLKEAMPGGTVPLQDFFLFTELVQRIDQLADALDAITGGRDAVSPAEFKRASEVVLSSTGRGLSLVQTQVLFNLFDTNRDGALARCEFLDIMRERNTRGLTKEKSLGGSILKAVSRLERRVKDIVSPSA